MLIKINFNKKILLKYFKFKNKYYFKKTILKKSKFFIICF